MNGVSAIGYVNKLNIATEKVHIPGNSKYGFSFAGRSNSLDRKPIGVGVWVKVHKPHWCIAVINIPVAIPIDLEVDGGRHVRVLYFKHYSMAPNIPIIIALHLYSYYYYYYYHLINYYRYYHYYHYYY